MTAYPRRPPEPERSETDRAFDTLVPDDLRHLSEAHWTPTDIAIRIVSLLSLERGDRVLDVGAGIGKLCSVAALSSPGHWVGIEHHEPLVSGAQRLAREFQVETRTTFLLGDAFSVDWDDFDVLYFYNPFEHSVFPDRIDEGTSALGFRARVARAEACFATLTEGTRIVTLNGFGGDMPASFERVHRERLGVRDLELACWVRT